jgi:Ca2+-binding RTX toxin-like protein
VQFDLAHGLAYNNFGGGLGVDSFINIQGFKGGNAADTFIGGAGNHSFDGGGGSNTLNYSAATTTVQFDIAHGLAYNNFGGSAVNVDSFSNVQIFSGGSGNDGFFGGAGYNVLIGGAGVDTLDYSALGGSETINFTAGTASKSTGGTDSFASIEVFKTGAGTDTIVGGAGNHSLDGGGGSDTLDYSAATTGVQFDLATGLAYNNFGGGSIVNVDQFTNIEVFKGGNASNVFNAANVSGAYTLIGGTAVDTFSFSGTFGNDSIANFTTGQDGINLDHTEFADFAAVQSHAQQVGNDTVINYDTNSSIAILNTLVSNLHASDFLFV